MKICSLDYGGRGKNKAVLEASYCIAFRIAQEKASHITLVLEEEKAHKLNEIFNYIFKNAFLK